MPETAQQPEIPIGGVCWLEIPVTDMARSQAFYKAVFGWEFITPPGSPEGVYAIFSKPNAQPSGGLHLVKEENLIQPKVDEKGQGQATNKIVLKVEEVDATLKHIESVGGKTIGEKKAIGGDMGHYGTFRDTEGNINGLWSKN